jgi:hypothetical protein
MLDATRKHSMVDLQLIEEVLDMLLGMDSLSDRLSQVLLFFLRLVYNNEHLVAQVNDLKFQSFINQIRNLIGENGSQWGQLSETNIVLFTQVFLLLLKSPNVNFYELSLNWALFFTVSTSKSPLFVFNILGLTENICMSQDENWANLKDGREELFYQTLSLFAIEASTIRKLSGPIKETLACLSRISKAVPENILLESALFSDVKLFVINL